MIRSIEKKDIDQIVEIYNHYITETVITFEEESVTFIDMSARIEKITTDNLPWLVAEDDNGTVIGYAYASKWRERFSYRYSVEVTAYLTPNATKKGIGSKLYEHLLAELKRKSIHTIIGGITLPNAASIALHEKFGMKQVAHFKEVGFKFKQWLDVGYWQGEL
ncbi:MAG: L-amino acid N-acyltransferase YncA [Alteromonadaceae bacterium]